MSGVVPAIELQHLEMEYGALRVLDDVSLEIREGEFTTLLGPSGCGKTTTLRIIAGYLDPTAGRVLIDGANVTGLPPRRRNIGMVFQNYALFPHLTVRDNIAFGLRARQWPSGEIRPRTDELLAMVQLERFAESRPHQLSGGMQQRVALARAIAFRPRILLMDEPLGALDVKLRKAMRAELKRIQRELGVTTVYVTHDQEEALSMSDFLVVMNRGRIVQGGTPEEVYRRPNSTFVADFVGTINLIRPVVVGPPGPDGKLRCRVGGVDVELTARKTSASVMVGVRPEEVRVGHPGEERWTPTSWMGTVTGSLFLGTCELLKVRVAELEQDVVAETRGGKWKDGAQVSIGWDPAVMTVIDETDDS
jgi:spermidine/putrescine ABC transporter ATP-binding subunit